MDAPPSRAASRIGARDALSVRVCGAWHGLPARDIARIMRPPKLTRVPNAPASLRGVADIGGSVVPVVSLADLLGRPAEAAGRDARVVVMEHGGGRDFGGFALLVEEVGSLAPMAEGAALDIDLLLARDYAEAPRRGHGGAASPPAAPARPAAWGETTAERSLLVFHVAGRDYALPLEDIAGIVALPPDVTGLPGTDAAMIGVTCWRGALLPLVSLRVLLGAAREAADPGRARVVVTALAGRLIGLVVDGMREVLRLPETAVDPVPAVLTRGRGEARIEAICRLEPGRRLIALLSPAGLFDTETTARILASAAPAAGARDSASGAAGARDRVVAFQLGDEHYGLPIGAIELVARCPPRFTPVPGAPDFLAGVMNIRGAVLPVIDQGRLFASRGTGEQGRAGGAARRVIVLTIGGLRVGILVHGVSGIIAVAASELRDFPSLMPGGARLFDRAAIERDGRMILLIEPDDFLGSVQREMIACFAQRGPARPRP
jgi:purine-binding chemotaxis protein CheW